MNLKKNCLVFHSYKETIKILKLSCKYKITPIIFFPYYLLNGLGIEWLVETRDMLQKEFGRRSFKTYIDSKNNSAVIEHEASTSKINEEQLFYCKQRGLSHEEAVSLIVNGFCKQVLQELPMEFAVEAQKLVSISLEGSVG